LDNELHENSPIPEMNRFSLAEVLSRVGERDTVFTNALRRVAKMESGAHAGHGMSPVLEQEN
jgi:hypothetical protein